MDKEIELLKLKIQLLEKEIEVLKLKQEKRQDITSPSSPAPIPSYPYYTTGTFIVPCTKMYSIPNTTIMGTTN